MIDIFKRMDKKFLIITGILITVPILLLFVLVIIRGCSSKTNYANYEKKMITAAEKYFKDNDMVPTLEGEKQKVSLEKLVKKGYLKSADRSLKDSSCAGDVTVQNNGASMKDNDGGYLYYYAVLECNKYKTETLKDNIISNVVTKGAGLYSTKTGYIFKGETSLSKNEYVNNYVSFSNNIYRILSIDVYGNLRMIKQTQEDNSIAWDVKYNEVEKERLGENIYGDSKFIDKLVNFYKNDKKISQDLRKYVVATDVCADRVDKDNKELNTNNNCTNVLKNQLISSLSIYDYSNASLDKDCTKINSRSCGNNNYLNKFMHTTWTINGVSNDTYNVYYLVSGIPYYQNANTDSYYNVIINITGNIYNYTGDGSEQNPYVIEK